MELEAAKLRRKLQLAELRVRAGSRANGDARRRVQRDRESDNRRKRERQELDKMRREEAAQLAGGDRWAYGVRVLWHAATASLKDVPCTALFAILRTYGHCFLYCGRECTLFAWSQFVLVLNAFLCAVQRIYELIWTSSPFCSCHLVFICMRHVLARGVRSAW